MKQCFYSLGIGMAGLLFYGLLFLLGGNLTEAKQETVRVLSMDVLYCGIRDTCLLTMDDVKKCVDNRTEGTGFHASTERAKVFEDIDLPVINLPQERYLWDVEEKELDILRRIVEAEAGGEDLEGKMLVANVVLNRVKEEDFPDTIAEVVYQNRNGTYQFSPAGSGRIDRVKVSEETVEAVENVLRGEDSSEGALYFVARKHAKKSSIKWFEEELEFLFCHGGHEFYK